MTGLPGSMLVAALCALCCAGGAQAQSVESYYRGRTVSLVVGYSVGGGYDLYARLAARFLGRHIPGQPTVVVQNMTGAGGLRAAAYVQRAAPKDGSVITLHPQTLPLDTVLGLSEGVDAGQFHWIGRLAMNVEVGVTLALSGLRSPDDLRRREVTVGGSGGTASSSLVPFLLNRSGGTRLKIISGYQSAQEAMLAMQRGEVEMVGATGISTMMAMHADGMKDGSLVLLYQTARQRQPALSAVPTLAELGTTADNRELLALFASTAEMGRSFAVSADVPRERLKALVNAFGAMLTDPEFAQGARDQNLIIEPASAEEVEALVRAALAMPKSIVEQARVVLSEIKAR